MAVGEFVCFFGKNLIFCKNNEFVQSYKDYYFKRLALLTGNIKFPHALVDKKKKVFL
jgi:hypothetical protein